MTDRKVARIVTAHSQLEGGGFARVGAESREVREGQLALLGPGTRVAMSVAADAARGARLLLLSGQPLGEPVARYGPFVMNTEQEILRAITDYQSGRLGEIRRA